MPQVQALDYSALLLCGTTCAWSHGLPHPFSVEDPMTKANLLSALFLALASPAVYAGVGRVPEPGTFELLALGGVVALVIGIRNRRKK
jgi:PEP-CTERM motif-containing protein